MTPSAIISIIAVGAVAHLVIMTVAMLAFGFGIIISSLTIKYRDFNNILALGIQLWMYATPIIYPVSIIPDKYRWISQINPMTALVEAFKFGLIGAGSVNVPLLIYSFLFSIVIFFIGIILFNRVEGTESGRRS